MTYRIKGVELNEADMREVFDAYRRYCVADQIMFESGLDIETALVKANLVIDQMDNNNLTEAEAMEVVLCNS